MESDKKLEKLETFLGRLNSKGELIDARSAQFLVFFAGGWYESIIEVRVKKDYCIIWCILKKEASYYFNCCHSVLIMYLLLKPSLSLSRFHPSSQYQVCRRRLWRWQKRQWRKWCDWMMRSFQNFTATWQIFPAAWVAECIWMRTLMPSLENKHQCNLCASLIGYTYSTSMYIYFYI